MPILSNEQSEKRLRALPGYIPPQRALIAKASEPVAKRRGGRVSKPKAKPKAKKKVKK